MVNTKNNSNGQGSNSNNQANNANPWTEQLIANHNQLMQQCCKPFNIFILSRKPSSGSSRHHQYHHHLSLGWENS
jgi:hypothetical protein